MLGMKYTSNHYCVFIKLQIMLLGPYVLVLSSEVCVCVFAAWLVR